MKDFQQVLRDKEEALRICRLEIYCLKTVARLLEETKASEPAPTPGEENVLP